MQWQHGSYTIYANGSMILTPIAVDGRQLYSVPCTGSKAVYTRYNQTETFKVRLSLPLSPLPPQSTQLTPQQSYEVLTDPYHNIPRLNLNQFDGSPLQPMYLVYSPPQMLPTITLNPTAAAAAPTATSAKKAKKVRRALGLDREVPVNFKESGWGKGAEVVQRVDTDRFWWVGLSMTGVGGLLYFGPRRMGL